MLVKSVAKIIFKAHRFFYGYPTKSEVRLGLEFHGFLHSNVGMLYICGESIPDICEWTSLSKEEVIDELNDIARGARL
jgi:hypothetical protein